MRHITWHLAASNSVNLTEHYVAYSICDPSKSVASLTYLVGQLLAKLNSQHPRPSSENNHAARAKFKKSNDDLWLAIQKLDLISTNFNRPKPEPVLTSSTQTPHGKIFAIFENILSVIKIEALLQIKEVISSKPKIDGYLAIEGIWKFLKETCFTKYTIKSSKERSLWTMVPKKDMFRCGFSLVC